VAAGAGADEERDPAGDGEARVGGEAQAEAAGGDVVAGERAVGVAAVDVEADGEAAEAAARFDAGAAAEKDAGVGAGERGAELPRRQRRQRRLARGRDRR